MDETTHQLRNRVCILVLGMHRSGTSALTRVLSIAGASLPSKLNHPSEGNELGHWEPLNIVELHERFLNEAGSRWDDWRRLELGRLAVSRIADTKSAIRHQLLDNYGQRPLIVVKDPRICRFAPIFIEAADEAGFQVKIVIPYRNPLEVIRSLQERKSSWREDQTLTYAGLLWLRYVLEAEASTRNTLRIFISYDSLLANVRSVLQSITENLKIEWPHSVDEVAPIAENFLSSAHRHQRSSSEEIVQQPALRGWISDTFEALQILAQNPKSSTAQAILDNVRREFDNASPTMDALLRETIQFTEANAAGVEAELSAAKNTALEMHGTIAEQTAELQDLASKLQDRDASTATATELADQRLVEIETLRQQLASQENEKSDLERRLREHFSEASSLRQALAASEATSAELLSASEIKYAGLIAERDELDAEVKSLRDRSKTEIGSLVDRLGASDTERLRLSEETNFLRQEALALRVTLSNTEHKMRAVLQSRSWRLLAVPRRVVEKLRANIKKAKGLNRRLVAKANALSPRTVSKAQTTFRSSLANDSPSETPNGESSRVPAKPSAVTRYDAWQKFNVLTVAEVASLRQEIDDRMGRVPTLSIVMPAYNAPIKYLDLAIESIRQQIHSDWELCIADDASPDNDVRARLKSWEGCDPRIKIKFLTTNVNISAATNAAASMATGEFLLFLDQDDALAPDALAQVAIALADEPEADYAYSDDDKIDIDNNRYGAQFKPGWSPTLLLSFMYMGHVKVVRRSLFEKLGGFRAGFEGSQDYDFALRACEVARKIVHIPKVLYHWRAVPGSTASGGDSKPASFEAGRCAVEEAFARRGPAVEVTQPEWATKAKVGIFEPRFGDDGPSVAIIIPTKNGFHILRDCVNSLRATTYRNYAVYIVDNGSDDPATLGWLASCGHDVLRIENKPGTTFNFSYLNNEAVRRVAADYVLLLNNDTVIRKPQWLSQMMGYARLPKVGAVGAKLLFPDGTIQHAGIAHGYYNGMAGPTFRNLPNWNHGHMSLAAVARECSAVTAACLLTPRALFLELGGLDEENFAVAYNDVDYCYRLADSGHSIIYCPGAELTHFEGKTRGNLDNLFEIAAFRKKYAGRCEPWINQNLSFENEHLEVAPHHLPLANKNPVRVVMVSHNLNLEGAPNSLREMAIGLKSAGVIDPVILSPADGPLRLLYEDAHIPVRIVASPLADVHDAKTFDTQLASLAKLIASLKAEVIYANTLQAFWAIACADRMNLPSVWNVRESEPWETYFDFLAPELRARAYGSFAPPYRVVFVANSTRAGWAPVESAFNFTVIPNGLDVGNLDAKIGFLDRQSSRIDLGIGEREIAIVLVGTVCERKGQLDAIEAFAKLPKSTALRTRLFLVGDRPSSYSSRIHAMLGQLEAELRSRIVIVPESNEVPKYLKAADIALCTSRIESFPRVILEAMAAGLPIITTPVFGIREQVRDGVNALFYEPGDIAALALAMQNLVDNDDFRKRLAYASRPVLDGLPSYAEMLRKYGDIFREARGTLGPLWAPQANLLAAE